MRMDEVMNDAQLQGILQRALASTADLEAVDPEDGDCSCDSNQWYEDCRCNLSVGKVAVQRPLEQRNELGACLGYGHDRDSSGEACRSIRFVHERDAVFYAEARRDILLLVAEVQRLMGLQVVGNR